MAEPIQVMAEDRSRPWPEGPNPHAAPMVSGRPVPRVEPPIELPDVTMPPLEDDPVTMFFGNPDRKDDPVNHPSHYTAYKGLEIIDLTEQMNFNRGNAVKYIARAGLKDRLTEIQDLEKASWYIRREIDRLKGQTGAGTTD